MRRGISFFLCFVLLMTHCAPLTARAADTKGDTKQTIEQRIANLEKNLTKKQQELEKKIAELLDQIKSLKEVIAKLSGKTSQTTAKKNEPAVKTQHSQDDLLTTAVERVAPGVVSIVISKDVPDLEVTYVNPFGDNPLFKDINFRVPVYRKKGLTHQKVGAGTGFVVSSDGYIVTNKHVVNDNTADYMVLLADGVQQIAKVYYLDPIYDLALIKIEGGPYTSVRLENSERVKLGQTVLAIGNALGEYNNSVSVGIISGLKRKVTAADNQGRREDLSDVFQTDAAINSGNSGGPLIDLNGNAIGVNVARIQESENIGFAIPINRVRDLVSLALGRSLPTSSTR